MKIEWAASPNFTPGRSGRKPIAVVDHITAGLMPGTLSWLQNPAAKASAHYLVTKAGQVFQLVKDEDTAWHAGIVNKPLWTLYDGTNPNYYTLGIEHEALAGESLTEKQYQATLWLHQQLISKWNIPIDRNHIIGHYYLDSINRRNDPGPNFPWDRLFAGLSSDQSKIYIKVGDTVISGTLIENRAYGPVRDLAQALGSEVSWDSNTNTVLVEPAIPADVTGIKIVVSNTWLSGIDINNRAFVSVRDLAKSLGREVSWDGSSKTVTIK